MKKREIIFKTFLSTKSVSIDSRTIKEGDVFFAIKGENFDGNKYIGSALKKGAILCIGDDMNMAKIPSVIVVPDALTALQELAFDFRKTFKFPVLAITGSNGKTTTKELLKTVLSQKYAVHATDGNLNNHIGVPLTILSTPSEVEFLIVEMGANAIGEIALLSEIACPDFGLITNIGKAHLLGFGGIEGVLKGKKELFKYCQKNNKIIFLNIYDERLKTSLAENSKAISYLDYTLVQEEPNIQLNVLDDIYNSVLFGEYNALNIVASITVGHYFSIPVKEMQKAIQTYIPDNNRSTIKKIKGATVIFDAYNANPTSVEKSLKLFLKLKSPEKVIVLGDMLELGDYANEEHINVIDMLKNITDIEVYFIGPIFSSLTSKNSFNNISEFKVFLKMDKISGKTFFLKGSRGIKLEKIFES